MYFSRLRKFLYAGALLAVAPFVAIAGAEPIAAPGAPATPAPATPAITSTATGACAPTTTKVKVCEMVPTQVQETRTVYKPVTKQETYTAYRYDTVSEVVAKQVTEYQKVTEMVNECRTTVVKVPVIEERTEMVTKWRTETVTEMVTKTVKGGHWECQTVPAGPSVLDRLTHKCPDPCATTTKKCWVPECHTECVPVCKKKLVKECVPVCKKVCTYRCETKTTMVPVCKTKCVPVCKTVNVTVCKKVCVPYQATRCVTTCVPTCETFTVCKMVPTWVEKEVAVAPATSCASPCDPCANPCGKAGLLSGLKGRFGHHSCCK